ncbi:MAG: histidinol-phosphate transaminase [Lachnospiraceae bacterium]|nr:histidinol-phosphate transaminase [Lachnospiraceae bacterium]
MSDWMKNVRDVQPYVPGEQPKCENVIKLNTNENPYPPAPGVQEIINQANTDSLRLYPDPEASVLVNALAEYHGVSTESVFVGVGSDDVLAMAFLTFFNSDKPILFPDITYSFYDVWAGLFKIPYEKPALKGDFTINIEDYMKPCGGIVIANPNAPTSIYEPVNNIERIIAAHPDAVVIVDEAYVDFGAESVLPLVNKYDNLLVVRTYSKSRSLAGLRIGYAVGNEALINALNSVKLSYNSYTMNMPSLIMGTEAIKDEAYFRDTLHKIVTTREHVKAELSGMGFSVLDSKTNFLFAKHESISAKYIFEELRKENIYVRYFNKPRIDNYLRITIGTDDEMAVFLDTVKKIKKSVDI